MSNLGPKIKNLRLEREMRQGELAKLLCVSKAEISFYENSKRIPPLNKLIKIAEIFDINISDLIFENQSSTKDYFYF